MAHPSSVEFCRFYNHYPFSAKVKDESIPSVRVQRAGERANACITSRDRTPLDETADAGDPALQHDSLKTRCVCELDASRKHDPLTTSVEIGRAIGFTSPQRRGIKHQGGDDSNVRIGLHGADYKARGRRINGKAVPALNSL